MGCKLLKKKKDFEEGFAKAENILGKKERKVTSKVDTLLKNVAKEQGSSVKDKLKKGLGK